jgi:hypothetical protein
MAKARFHEEEIENNERALRLICARIKYPSAAQMGHI